MVEGFPTILNRIVSFFYKLYDLHWYWGQTTNIIWVGWLFSSWNFMSAGTTTTAVTKNIQHTWCLKGCCCLFFGTLEYQSHWPRKTSWTLQESATSLNLSSEHDILHAQHSLFVHVQRRTRRRTRLPGGLKRCHSLNVTWWPFFVISVYQNSDQHYWGTPIPFLVEEESEANRKYQISLLRFDGVPSLFVKYYSGLQCLH